MRATIISLLIVIVSCSLFGQTINSTESKDLSNIYNHALKVYFDSAFNKNYNHSVRVQYESLTTSHLPNKLGNINIEVIEYNELTNLIAKNKSIELLKISPIRFDNDNFYINIALYRVSSKRKIIEYSILLGMGIKVKYSFDCNSKCFIFEKIE